MFTFFGVHAGLDIYLFDFNIVIPLNSDAFRIFINIIFLVSSAYRKYASPAVNRNSVQLQ